MKSALNLKIFSLLVLSLPATCFGSIHSTTQHAGEIGEIALGIGKSFTKRFAVTALWGVHRNRNALKDQTLHTIAVKTKYNLFDLKNYFFYPGLTVFHTLNDELKTYGNENYPEGYYRIGTVRLLLYLGLERIFNQKHTLFYELGANDITLTNAYNNDNQSLQLHDLSAAVGYSYRFN